MLRTALLLVAVVFALAGCPAEKRRGIALRRFKMRGKGLDDKELWRACMMGRGYNRIEGGQWEGLRD